MVIKKFEEQVKKFKHKAAVKVDTEVLTYSQLNQYANRLAAVITAAGEENNQKQAVVALLFEPGADMIIGFIAALKANMIYLPLDRTYPENRLAYMLVDSEAAFILTNKKNLALAERLAVKTAKSSKITIVDIHGIAMGHPGENIDKPVSGQCAAYILYTSGSTGNPKGVVQNRENLLYYTRNWIRIFTITNNDRMTLFSSFCHDGA